MSRPASGDDEVLANAREAIAAAQTVEQLRQAQAVVFAAGLRFELGRYSAGHRRVAGLDVSVAPTLHARAARWRRWRPYSGWT